MRLLSMLYDIYKKVMFYLEWLINCIVFILNVEKVVKELMNLVLMFVMIFEGKMFSWVI